MYASQTGSTLIVPSRHLVRNVAVFYARWWHGVALATWTAIYITAPPPPLGKGKKNKRGIVPNFEQPEDAPLLGEPPSS